VPLRQNGVGTGFTSADAILPKGHDLLVLSLSSVHCVQLLSAIRRDVHLLRIIA